MKSLISTITVSVLLLASGSQAAYGQNQMEEGRIYLNGGYEIVEGGLLSSTIGGGFYGQERDWPIPVDTRFEYFIAPNGFSLAQFSVHGVFEIEQAPDLLTPYVGAGVSFTSTSTSDSLASPELGEIDLPASPTNSGIDIGISLVAGGRFDLGGVDPFIQAEAIGGDQYQSVGLTAGISIDPGSLFSVSNDDAGYTRELSGIVEEEPASPFPVYSGALTSDTVPIYVHLQVHESPIERSTDRSRTIVGNCQRAIYNNAVALAKRKGATAVASEALLRRGSWENPLPYRPGIIDTAREEGEPLSAEVELLKTKGIQVYGFETQKNPLAIEALQEKDRLLKDSSQKEEDIEETRQLATTADLINASRSFDALYAAYRAATTSESKGAQLIIGAAHLEDLRWLVDEREEDLYVRLYFYEYDECN